MRDHEVPIETLLQHRAWVRHLAGTLVWDPATAEDVEQKTWLRALLSRPQQAGSARAWLARVVRSQALNEFRSASRRRGRESAAAASGTARSTADLAAEVESHKILVTAVMGLDDPYRATVLLRFYSDLPPREVARQMDVPVETVRTRTRRALALLRERLGGAEGRNGWLGTILPLVGAGRDGSLGAAASTTAAGMAATTTVGGVAMAGKATIAVAVALGCASGFVGGRLSSTVSGSDVGNQVEMLQARVADLETEPARAPILRGRSGPASEAPLPVQPGMSEPLEAALLALLESPSPALRARFREALEDPVSERDEPTVRLSDEEERKLAEFIADIDAVLDGWSETYGLREFQVEELKVVARRSVARMVEAKRQGASPQELAAMDVAAQAEVRRIVGDAVYLATERERVTGEARKALTWLSAAVGLTPTQHTQLDRLVAEGVERDLPAIVRLRSESLIDDDREALQRSLEQQREENWLRIRNELLTEEQRQRIPGK